MLLDTLHHKKLLNEAWTIRRVDNKTYYIKYIFEENEYVILVTDLCLVWFEHGDYKRIQQNAKVQNIDIESKGEAVALLVRLKQLFLESISRCSIKKEVGKLKLHCKLTVSQIRNRINTLSWIFDCELLDQETTNDDALSGPQVIYDHFIQPSQAIVNHFTENMSDENQIKLKMARASASMYSTTSLSYMSELINDKNAATTNTTSAVTHMPLDDTESQSQNEEIHIMTNEELEEKKRHDLQILEQEERKRLLAASKKRRRL
ncbi:nicotinate-nucleotide diphosphorylase (carboxylating) [Mucor circinelloides]